MSQSLSRLSPIAQLVAVVALVAGIVFAIEAAAHHPGSHAFREADGRVRLEAVATASDACTAISGVTQGTPAGVTAPAGSVPVVVQLVRRSGSDMCATVVKALNETVFLPVAPAIRQLHVYVVDSAGKVLSTERIPVN